MSARARRWCVLFFFQAEDGIRDVAVTGVQTCALPIFLLAVVDLAWSQGSATPSGQASAAPSGRATGLPMFRPVLIGQGPTALINRMDEQDLVRKGQKDALVMFLCAVKKDGGVEWSATYRGTPDSDILKQELQKRISPASNPRFIPAVHDHQLVDAIYYGT